MAKKSPKKAKKATLKLVIPTKREGCEVRATKSLQLVIPTKKQGCYIGFEES